MGNSHRVYASSLRIEDVPEERATQESSSKKKLQVEQRKVEEFLINSYICSPRIDAVWLLLANSTCQNSFRMFLNTRESSLELFLIIAELKGLPTIMDKDIDEGISKIIAVGDVFNQLHFPETANFFRDCQSCERLELVSLFRSRYMDKLQHEAVKYLASEEFPAFIESKFFAQWRTIMRNHAIATTPEDIAFTRRSLSEPSSGRTRRSIKVRSNNARVSHPDDTVTRAFENSDRSHIVDLLVPGSWVASLVGGAETLPLCLTLSAVSEDLKDSVIIYVNKHFMNISGYERSDLLGKDIIGLMDSSVLTNEERGNIWKSLCSKTRSSAGKYHFVHSQGSTLLNFAFMKFIYCKASNTNFIVSIHFLVIISSESTSESLYALGSTLIDMLPIGLTVEDEEELSTNAKTQPNVCRIC
jgi:hypothetical protein